MAGRALSKTQRETPTDLGTRGMYYLGNRNHGSTSRNKRISAHLARRNAHALIRNWMVDANAAP
jgi:hypothetical protein